MFRSSGGPFPDRRLPGPGPFQSGRAPPPDRAAGRKRASGKRGWERRAAGGGRTGKGLGVGLERRRWEGVNTSGRSRDRSGEGPRPSMAHRAQHWFERIREAARRGSRGSLTPPPSAALQPRVLGGSRSGSPVKLHSPPPDSRLEEVTPQIFEPSFFRSPNLLPLFPSFLSSSR